MERRSLLDGDQTPTREQMNVFDDEFEVEDFDLVADGFRPGHNHDREGTEHQSQEEEEVPIRSVSAHYAPAHVMAGGPSRDSTRKSRGQDNPFASPEDEAELPLHRTPSGNFAPFTHRSISSSSSHQYASTNSPRFGASGPSHPYGMYPQGTMARTASVATTSTVRPTRYSSTRNGPQHPYALYPQGVDPDLDDDTEQNHVPIGFIGLGQTFHRRRGPDGEEQDIIGDYGHTEQLPPYTRYPEDGPEKVPLLDVPNPPTALHSRAPVLGTDPSMPLMHAQLHPTQTQQSMMDQSNLTRQPSTMSGTSRMSSLNTMIPKEEYEPQRWKDKSWSQRFKTRFCGIPFWLIAVVAVLTAFIGALVGGVIGGYVEGAERARHQSNAKSTSLYDASFIATPTATSPPLGTFALQFGKPQETQSACLIHEGQKAAWSCDIADNAAIAMVVHDPVGGTNQSGAILFNAWTQGGQLYYGTQASSFVTQFSPFLLVLDNDDRDKGEAFYFAQPYDKLVVVPNTLVDVKNSKLRRNFYDMPASWSGKREAAVPGEKPWMCYWNNTFLEGFIYKEDAKAPSYTPTLTTPSLYTGLQSPTGSSKSTSSPSQGTSTLYPTPTGDPADTITTTLTMPSTTCTYTGVASEFVPWLTNNYPKYTPSVTPSAGSGSSSDSMPRRRKRDDDDDDDDDDNDDDDDDDSPRRYYFPDGPMGDSYALYPKLVKIEERRLADSPQPYCVQYQVLNDWSWNVVTDEITGQPIRIDLAEQDPGYTAYEAAGLAGNGRRRKRDAVPGACHCQWLSGG